MEFNFKAKGSVTVFMSMTIIMVMSLVFALVEVVHFTGLNEVTKTVSKLGTESAFADFNRPLLEEFGVLGIDGGYCKEQLDISKLEARITTYLIENINPNISELANANFYRANPSVEVLDYGVLTDSGGAAFIKEAVMEAIYSLPDEVLDSFSSKTGSDSITDMEFSESDVEKYLADSNKQLSEADYAEDSGDTVEIESHLSPSEQANLNQNGNPIDAILAWKSKAILSQVISDTASISQKVISNDRPSKRVSGWETTGGLTVSGTDKMFYGQYLKQKFGSYRTHRDHGGLSYEWEYVINGKDSDLKNLEATVVKLLGLREAQNFAAIMADPGKQETALGIATAICAAVALPALIEAVKMGVIAAWAYLESVLDVRLLLVGGKVAPVKNTMQWTSNILLFPNYINPSVMARQCTEGLDYEDYLMVMTLGLSSRNMGMRGLDVVEAAIRNHEDYAVVRMENFIYRARFIYSYEASPMFASVTPMLAGRLDGYTFEVAEEMSYL